jgi:transposase-like protein
MAPECPKCQGNSVKNGFVKGFQRWQCKQCNHQFRPDLPERGKPLWMKLESVLLYSSGMSLRAVAKHLQVSVQSILVWVKDFSKANKLTPPTKGSYVVLELDEMWHFIEKKNKNAGSGKFLTVVAGDCLRGNWEIAVLKH